MSPEEREESVTAVAVAAPVSESQEGNNRAPVAKAASAAPTTSTPPIAQTEMATGEGEEATEALEERSEIKEVTGEEISDEEEKDKEKPPAPKPTTAPERTLDREPSQRERTYDYDYSYPYTKRHEHSSMGAPMERFPYPFFLHNNFLMLFFFIGMIFILIGGILSGSAIISSTSSDISGIVGASVITISLGLFTVSTFLILAALFRVDLNHFVRLGLLITGAFSIFGIVIYPSVF